jgi:hypothetical protein
MMIFLRLDRFGRQVTLEHTASSVDRVGCCFLRLVEFCSMFSLGLPWSLAHMALIEAKQGVSRSWIVANTHWGGADASGDTYHQRVVVVHVHDSLLFFCLHPAKMVEPAAFPVDESGMALSSRMVCFPDFSA